MKRPVRLAAALLVASLALAGCGGEAGESNDFEGRLRALEGAYERGKQARAQYVKVGIKVGDETACNDAWTSSGAKDEETINRWVYDEKGKQSKDTAFQELRRLSFINGCLGRPNNLTPPSASTPVTPSASASAG